MTDTTLPSPEKLERNEYAPIVGGNIYASKEHFEFAARCSAALSRSSMVPKDYQGSPENCMIAFDLAMRLDLSPFLIMQKVSMVHGKPCMEGQLCIALANQRGGFDHNLRWDTGGEGDDLWYQCWTTEGGKRIESGRLTLAQVKKAGWYSKNPNWQTITDQMFKYRTASFFLKTHRPELMMGLQTQDEVIDVGGIQVVKPKGRKSDLNNLINGDKNGGTN